MHKKDNWQTPSWLIEQLENEFGDLFDPCPIDPIYDGLKIKWKSPAYCNPPYGHAIVDWLKYGIRQWANGQLDTLIYLLPARTDTQWFHNHIVYATQIRFIKGRLHFSNGRYPAPFPSMIVIYSKMRSVPEVIFDIHPTKLRS